MSHVFDHFSLIKKKETVHNTSQNYYIVHKQTLQLGNNVISNCMVLPNKKNSSYKEDELPLPNVNFSSLCA